MAVTGLLLVLFLFAHMVGNLKIFFGGERLRPLRALAAHDRRARCCQTSVVPVDPASRAAVAVVAAHVGRRDPRPARRARPARSGTRTGRRSQGSYAARTMRWGGVIILLFVIYHLLDLTTGTVNPVGDAAQPYGERDRRLRAVALVRDALLHRGDGGRRLPPAARHLQRAARRWAGTPPRGERRARAIAAVVAAVAGASATVACPSPSRSDW